MDKKNKEIEISEPRMVKSHDVKLDAEYAEWIAEVKYRYRSAQVKAAVKVNGEKLLFRSKICKIATTRCRIEGRKTPTPHWRISETACFRNRELSQR